MCTYKLKYNDYFTNLSDGLRSMLASEDITDVTLAVEGRFFKAHQMILSIFSSYFRELFITNPCQHPIFFLKDVKYQIMKDLLTFMYEGMVQIAEENFNMFVDTARALQVKGLTNIEELPNFGDPKVEAAEDSWTMHTNEPIKVPNADKGLKRMHDFHKAVPLDDNDDLQELVNENEVQVATVAKKYKGINQMPVPSLSEVTVLPLAGSSANWKPDRHQDSGPEEIANVAETKGDVIQAQCINIQNTFSIEGNKKKALQRILLDAEAQYKMPVDTIDLDDDRDDFDMKPDDDYSADNSQEEDDLEITGEGLVEGEPVSVACLKRAKTSLLEIGGFVYYRHRSSRKSGGRWLRWRCARCPNGQVGRTCGASVYTCPENLLIYTSAHDHPAYGSPADARVLCREIYHVVNKNSLNTKTKQ